MNWDRLAWVAVGSVLLGLLLGFGIGRWTAPSAPSPWPAPPVTGAPSDNLVESLQSAYNTEGATDKAQKTGVLASVMDEAAKQALLKDASGNYVVTTNKQLLDAVHTVTDQKVGKGQIPKVRDVVGAYLNSVLPRQDGPMTDETRQKAASAYSNVATALKKVK